MTYLTHLAGTMGPVLGFLAAGFLLGRRRWLPLGWGSAICLYVFAPAQTISGIVHSRASLLDAVTLITAVGAHLLVMILLGLAIGRWLGLEGDRLDAFLLCIGFANCGFLGLPVCWLGFGKPGFDAGVLVMLAHSLFANTVAIWLAARGRSGPAATLRRVVTSPVLLSTVLAMALAGSGIREPAWFFTAVDLVGQASIPAVLLLLGAQLAVLEGEPAIGLALSPAGGLRPQAPVRAIPRARDSIAVVAWAVGLRLVAGGLVAVPVALATGLEGSMARVFVLEFSMPTGVSMSLFALHYGCQPRFVSTVVLLGTLGSLVTLPAVLVFLV